MSTMNISLPDTLKSFVDEQVSQRGYGTSSEYVRELIRKDQDRLQLRQLLLAHPRPQRRLMALTLKVCATGFARSPRLAPKGEGQGCCTS